MSRTRFKGFCDEFAWRYSHRGSRCAAALLHRASVPSRFPTLKIEEQPTACPSRPREGQTGSASRRKAPRSKRREPRPRRRRWQLSCEYARGLGPYLIITVETQMDGASETLTDSEAPLPSEPKTNRIKSPKRALMNALIAIDLCSKGAIIVYKLYVLKIKANTAMSLRLTKITTIKQSAGRTRAVTVIWT